MRKMISKKAQVYGLSSFIYALAIAVVLLVGLIGMSKEFEIKSTASKYEANTMILDRTAETAKKLIEQERRYALEKSIFMTGALGGNGLLTPSSCGDLINTNITFVPDKVVKNWKNGGSLCIPSDASSAGIVEDFAEQYFSKPDTLITDILASISSDKYLYSYVPKLTGFTYSTFDMSWFPTGTVTTYQGVTSPMSEITLRYPAGNPMVEYSFQPFVHTTIKTSFLAIKSTAETFVKNNYLSGNFSDENNRPFSNVIDEDLIIAKKDSSAPVKNCQTSPGYPSDYCTQNSSDMDHPFKTLVNYYVERYPSTTAPLYMLDGRDCYGYLTASGISNRYDYSCTVYTKYNSTSGHLDVDTKQGTKGFSGCSSGTGNDSAMKCILLLQINQLINDPLKSTSPDGMSQKIEFNTFNLTYQGSGKTNYVYNTTISSCNGPAAGTFSCDLLCQSNCGINQYRVKSCTDFSGCSLNMTGSCSGNAMPTVSCTQILDFTKCNGLSECMWS